MRGISDIPIKELNDDCFSVSKYVKGLAEYIKICETPTTIAVQGDWGSGKTSMLNMVKVALGAQVKTVWFNTWQYSKFNMDNRLPLSLLQHLYNALCLDSDPKSQKKMARAFSSIAAVGIKAGTYVMDIMGAQKLAEDIDNGINKDSRTTDDEDLINVIENLKNDFQQAIDDIYRKENKRIAVFIDDLDRLAPVRAVELMEVLKLFLDCRHCVFILAIDYDVVTRGISVKYGDDFGKKQGKKFFDKIIQVPFFIPVEQYDIKEYVRRSMPAAVKLDEENMPDYISMISSSVGCNPRSMKRLFNAFLLISMINIDSEFVKDPIAQKLLFAILCMQLSMEDIYKYIVENSANIDEQFFLEFLEEKEDEDEYFIGINITDEEFNADGALTFMRQLANIVKGSGEMTASNNVNKIKEILTVSSSTNNVIIRKQNGTAELIQDTEIEKTIGNTDMKYKILTCGSKFNIGQNQPITLVYNQKEYVAKMHSTAKGRIDGLKSFYTDSTLKEGDKCTLKYVFAEKKVYITINR